MAVVMRGGEQSKQWWGEERHNEGQSKVDSSGWLRVCGGKNEQGSDNNGGCTRRHVGYLTIEEKT